MSRENGRNRSVLSWKKSILALAAFAAAPSLVGTHSAHAASFTWDNNGATAPIGQDGAGTWDTTLQNFTDGVNNFAWNNTTNAGDTAVFGNTANGGAVTLTTPIVAGGITLNRAGYSLVGTTTNNLTLGGASPTITANANGILNVPITGTSAINIVVNGTASIGLQSTGTINNTGGAILSGGGTFNTGSASFQGLQDGSLTFSGINVIVGNTQSLGLPIFITGGTSNNISGNASANITVSGALTGTGTLNIGDASAGSIMTLSGNNSNFQGTLTATTGGLMRMTSDTNGLNIPQGTLDLSNSTGRVLNNRTNPTYTIGALASTGGGILQGSNTATGVTVYEVGTLGTNTTYLGEIRDGTSSDNTTIAHARQVAIRKVGNGKLTLGGAVTAANAYTGSTTINGGTLALATANPTAGSATIAVNVGTFTSPGAFDVTALSGGYTIPAGQTLQGSGGTVYGTVSVTNPTGIVNPGVNGNSPAGGSLNFSNTLTLNGGTVQFDLSNSTSSNDDLLSVNALNLTAPSKLYLSPIGAFTTGTYRLINYTSLSGGTASLSNLSIASASAITAQLDTSTPGQINLNILSLAPAANIRWNGPGTVWDIGSSQNFLNTSSSAATAFFQGDNVTFDDNGSAAASLSVTAAVQPSAVHFNNNTVNYTLTGPGSIGGNVGIVKDGSGSVALNMANPYTGGTTINSGTLRTNNPNGFNGGSINLNGGTLGIDGAITLTNLIFINNTGATLSGNGSFGNGTLGGIQSLGNLVNFDIPSGSTISMGTINFLNDLFTGTVNLGASNGTFRFVDGSPIQASLVFDLGTGSGQVVSRDDNGHSITLAGIAGGPNTKIFGSSNTNSNMTYVIGLAPGIFGMVPSQSTFAGQLNNGTAGSSATVNIAKNGAGYRLILSGNNGYTGSTDIVAGTLEVDGTNSGTGVGTVESGATLTGTGVFSGRVEAPGGTVQPGSVANPTGALTVGTLNLSGANLAFTFQNGGASKVNVSNANGLLTGGTANVSINDLGGTSYGRYTLVDYAGTPLSDLNAFNPNTGITVGGLTGNLVNNTFNTSVDLYLPNPAAHDSTWSGASSNQWTTGATTNWTNGFVPGSPDDFATFTDTGAGTVNLATPETVSQIVFNTSTGSYNISGSTLTLDASGGYVNINVLNGTQTISSPVVLGKQTYLGVDTPATLVMSGQISGSMPVIKSGAGTLVLSGNNTFSGPVTLNSGTLVASSSTSIGDGSSTNTLALGGGTLVVTGTFNSPATRSVQLLGSSAIEHGSNNVEIDGTISGGGKLTSNGTGTLTLGGTNSFTGGLTINNGTAQALVPQGVGTGRITVNGGTVIVPGSVTYSNAITVSGGATLAMGSEGQGTFSGAITDGGSTWTVIPGTTTGTTINMTTTTLGAANVTGTMIIGGSGTVRLIGTTGGFNVSSLTVDLGSANGVLQNRDAGIGSVQLAGLLGGPSTILRGAGSSAGLTNWHIGYSNADTTFNGSITDGTNPATLALTKEGTGVLTLNGNLTYTGGTTVVSGGLKVNKIAPGPVAVNAGSLLVMAKGTPNDISGTSVITSAPTIATGASMDITNNAVIVDYATLGTQLTDIRGNLAAGKLISSTKLSDQAIGYADASFVGRTTFGGVTLADTTNIVVGVVNTGDANVDGHVNALDFNAVATDFGMTGTGVWQLGDFNYDGNVNTLDFNALAGNFNKILSNAPAPALGSLVPEPASLGAIVVLGLVGRRRRRA